MELSSKPLAKRSSDRMQTSPRLEMQSPAYAEWIIQQVTILAGALKETVTSPTYTVYAQALWDIPEHCLREMFARVPRECDFLPKPKEMRDMALQHEEPPAPKGWQGPSEEEKRERDEFVGSDEAKQFIAELHAAAKKVVKPFPAKAAQVKRPIRELSDAEFEQRRTELQQQVEIATQRFGS